MKTKILLLVLSVFLLSNSSKATHLAGGEITWRCLSNGSFVFYMNVYRNCANINGNNAAQWDYTPAQYIGIVGASLPRNANNQSITSIALNPDNVKWANNNNGDLATECAANGTNLSCSNLDYGSLQVFYYESAPIQLNGTPPPSGWKFFFEPFCCRFPLDNINPLDNAAPLLLRSYMYSSLANNPTNVCYDNSPVFVETTSNVFCRGLEYNPSAFALDEDSQDSLSYQFSNPLNPPISNPVSVRYQTGYSSSNPTPDSFFDPGNIAFTLNNKSGEGRLKINSGLGPLRYSVVIQVDSWRQGKRISSIFREMPYTVIDCSLLPSGSTNNNPNITINSTNTSPYIINIVAGRLVNVPIQISDLDLVQGQSPPIQSVTCIPKGNQFAVDFATSTNCNLPPCATLINSTPSYNAAKLRYDLIGPAGVSTVFNWQTDSTHLGPNYSMKSYYFYFKTFDDHCPVPASKTGVLTVNVLPFTTDVEETKIEKTKLTVFPNPNNGQFYIRSNKSETYMVSIRNLQGQLISQSQYENTNQIKVDLNENAGIYILEVENERGERFQEKVIKL